ncbi:hypothetical protein [uncultured Nostoc sp.]|uniref:hypothetical protein n=1 Tax=uncultured Nostoc sp. TaxID=340711 RepID=UPI0035CB92AC
MNSQQRQVAIAQLLTVQSQHTEILNSHTAKFDEQSRKLDQILEILRDAEGELFGFAKR